MNRKYLRLHANKKQGLEIHRHFQAAMYQAARARFAETNDERLLHLDGAAHELAFATRVQTKTNTCAVMRGYRINYLIVMIEKIISKIKNDIPIKNIKNTIYICETKIGKMRYDIECDMSSVLNQVEKDNLIIYDREAKQEIEEELSLIKGGKS